MYTPLFALSASAQYIAHMLNKYLAPALFALLICSCKKNEEPAGRNFELVNTLAQPVTVRIYPTAEDFYNNTAVAATVEIPANNSGTIPMSTLNEQDYYVEWYTHDFKQGSWPVVNNRTDFISPIYPQKEASYTIRTEQDFSAIRTGFINGNGTTTTWRSITAGSSAKITVYKNGNYILTENGHRITDRYSVGAKTLRLQNGIYTSLVGFDPTFTGEDTTNYFPTRDTAILLTDDPALPLQFYRFVKEK